MSKEFPELSSLVLLSSFSSREILGDTPLHQMLRKNISTDTEEARADFEAAKILIYEKLYNKIINRFNESPLAVAIGTRKIDFTIRYLYQLQFLGDRGFSNQH